MKQIKYTPLHLALIIIVGLLLFIAAYPSGCKDTSFEGKHTLYFSSPGFNGTFDGLTIYFNEPLDDNRIKVLFDDEVYWIRLEVD